MSDDKTFRLKYKGARFDGARLPVDVLSDLPAFRDLLVAYAKDQFRNANAKQRVPKGFDKGLSFDLIGVENGSAVPVLSWNRNLAQANLPGIADEVENIVDASYGKVVRLLDDAGRNVFPKSLPAEYVRALNRLGSGLRDHERIEFDGATGKDGQVVYLDNHRRKALITRVRETYQSRLEGTGILRGMYVDSDGSGFLEVDTTDYGLIKIYLERDRIKEEFNGSLELSVQFDLQAELDNGDKLVSIVEVFDIVVIDAQREASLERCRARLGGFRDLEPGWHDGDGEAIGSAAFAAADRFLSKRPALAGAYKIYPTSEGGILFEFEHGEWAWSVELAASGAVEFYGVQIDGESELEPQGFPAMDDEFLRLFDEKAGRN